MNLLKTLFHKLKTKKTNNIIETKDISTRAILVDITDVRNIIQHDSVRELDQKLYDMFWRDNDFTLMDIINITMYIEIPYSQMQDILIVLSKSKGLFHHSVVENDKIRFILQGSVTAFREYILNSNPVNSENLYKLIIRTLYQTQSIYFTDMINDGVFVKGQMNSDYHNQACNIIDDIKFPPTGDTLYTLLYFNNIDKVCKLCNIDTRYILSLNYFILKDRSGKLHKYTLQDCKHNKAPFSSLIYEHIIKHSNFNIEQFNYGPAYEFQFDEKYFEQNIDEVIDDESIKSDYIPEQVDLSDTIKDFYRNGGIDIHEETDFREI